MTIKEIHTRAGSLWRYINYVALLFFWYFLNHRLTSFRAGLPDDSSFALVDWALLLVVSPLLLAGIFGGIYAHQRSGEQETEVGFLQAIGIHVLRFLAANFIFLVVYLTFTLILLAARGLDAEQLAEHKLLAASLSIPYSAIGLFGFTAIVTERRVFRSIFRGIGTLFLNPFALLIGILWGLVNFADSTGIDYPTGALALPIDALRAAVLAVARVGAIAYALAIYRSVRGDVAELPEGAPDAQASADARLITASFGFSLVSFLPLLHLVALILGMRALRRGKQFSLKAVVACVLGGFFTIYYALMLVGWLVSRAAPPLAPGYAFLKEVDGTLGPQVVLLEQGSFQTVQEQLEQNLSTSPDHAWTIDTALALARWQARDLAGSLEEFGIAAEKQPGRSEFYYYYGIVLLEAGQDTQAARQFQTALTFGPPLTGARQYNDLLESTYQPSQLVSGLLYVFILLILFTLHEYGHAFAAWKLGDDTAQKQGRLTLNPIPHLELFGSILLPAILVFQQSEFIFGWARPVPVDPRNFKEPQKDHMLVSFAGPAMNLLIAMLSLILLSGIMLAVHLVWPETMSLNLARPFSPVSLIGPPFARWLILVVLFLKQLFYTSLVLGCFNLLPIPPLDGSWILSGWLSPRWRNTYEKVRQFGFVILILLMWTHIFDYILLVPVMLSWGVLELLISAMGLG